MLVPLLLSTLVVAQSGDWINAPRMHDPSRTSVVLAAIPTQDSELQVSWGAGQVGAVVAVRGGQLWTEVVGGLDPGSTTEALVSLRPVGARAWQQQVPLNLRTLPGETDSTRFALLADTHAWALYTKKHLLGNTSFEDMLAVLDNTAVDAALDFGVVFTDSAMTNCGGGCFPMDTPLGSTTVGDANDLDDALVRYRSVWGQSMLGGLAAQLPLFTANGDHEGEQGWFADEVVQWSSEARALTLPPFAQNGLLGPAGSLAYAFETGPVLVVVIDVHSASERKPTQPEHWRLGAAQHAWLYDVLAASRKRWKIVLAEHVLGGGSNPQQLVWKARGTITATSDGTASGTFLGEQALVHQTLLATGADLFVSAHDHVVAWGLKDGVAYLTAGRAGGVPHPWTDQGWYRQLMDFDGDGVPEYDTGVTGTRLPGHVVIDADQDTLRVDYVRGSSQDAAANGQVLLSFELQQSPVAPGGGGR